MRVFTPGLVLLAALSTATATVHALPPYPTPDCGSGWWIERTDVPLVVRDAPSSPTILLPAQWSPWNNAADVARLRVEVVDSEGEIVPGVVRYEPDEPPVHVPRWTPDAPLALSTHYQLTVRVAEPPLPAHPACHFVAFERRISIDTGDGSMKPAALVIVALEARDTVTRELEVGESVCGGWAGRCEGAPEICCRRVEVRRQREIFGLVIAEAVTNPEPLYNLIRGTIHGLPDGPGESVIQAVAEGGTYAAYDRWTIEWGQPVPSAICMNVALIDVLRGETTAEAETCGLTAAYEMHGVFPVLTTCPADVCPGGTPGDGVAEPHGADVGPGGTPAEGVAEPHGADEGCAGGPRGVGWFALALLFAPGLRRERARGSSRAGTASSRTFSLFGRVGSNPNVQTRRGQSSSPSTPVAVHRDL